MLFLIVTESDVYRPIKVTRNMIKPRFGGYFVIIRQHGISNSEREHPENEYWSACPGTLLMEEHSKSKGTQGFFC